MVMTLSIDPETGRREVQLTRVPPGVDPAEIARRNEADNEAKLDEWSR
jgi:hypothetical protein